MREGKRVYFGVVVHKESSWGGRTYVGVKVCNNKKCNTSMWVAETDILTCAGNSCRDDVKEKKMFRCRRRGCADSTRRHMYEIDIAADSDGFYECEDDDDFFTEVHIGDSTFGDTVKYTLGEPCYDELYRAPEKCMQNREHNNGLWTGCMPVVDKTVTAPSHVCSHMCMYRGL